MSNNHTQEFTNFKLYSDSTFKKLTKDELIDYIKMLHHNWSATDEQLFNVMNVAKENQKYNQLTEQLGCPVEVAIKALEQSFYVKGKLYKGIVRLIYNPIDKDYELELVDENDFVYLYDYKKTWWFKEDRSE